MLHFHMTDGKVDAASELSSADHHQISETGQWLPRGFNATKGISEKASGWFNRWDVDSMATAEAIAEALNAKSMRQGKSANAYTAADSGPSVSPRFDVIRAPQVGDEVSSYFNGDGYPEGKVTRVSVSLRRVQTSTGAVFYRQGASARWIKAGGTWAMISGHYNDRNPHF